MRRSGQALHTLVVWRRRLLGLLALGALFERLRGLRHRQVLRLRDRQHGRSAAGILQRALHCDQRAAVVIEHHRVDAFVAGGPADDAQRAGFDRILRWHASSPFPKPGGLSVSLIQTPRQFAAEIGDRRIDSEIDEVRVGAFQFDIDFAGSGAVMQPDAKPGDVVVFWARPQARRWFWAPAWRLSA